MARRSTKPFDPKEAARSLIKPVLDAAGKRLELILAEAAQIAEKAVLAERARCAGLAEGMASDLLGDIVDDDDAGRKLHQHAAGRLIELAGDIRGKAPEINSQ